MPALILASSSRYRQELLGRLGLPFQTLSPDIDETSLPGETAAALVERLAAAKAAKVGKAVGDAVVVASDQVVAVHAPEGERILGKPGNRTAALSQLAALSGREAHFLTGVCVRSAGGGEQLATETTVVRFRRLDAPAMVRYIDREQPFDCCGALRSEGLGVALLERIECTDPNALIGLPLIRLCAMLRRAGMDPLG